MRPIRPHKKSRTGCTTCRKRRVKCDEAKPRCSNCFRRELACSYTTAPSTTTAADTSAAGPSTTSTPTTTSADTSPAPSVIREPPQSPPTSGPSPNLANTPDILVHSALQPISSNSPINVLTLELLHHYTTRTAETLSFDSAARAAWATAVPQLAFQPNNTFLLHAILAISASHLHHLHTRRPTLNPLICHASNLVTTQYALAATRHHQAAVRAFRECLDHGTEERAGACFATSSIIVYYAVANNPRDADAHPSTPQSVSWMSLPRGTLAILIPYWSQVRQSPLAPIMEIGTEIPTDEKGEVMIERGLHPTDISLNEKINEISVEDDGDQWLTGPLLPADLENLATVRPEGADCSELEQEGTVEVYHNAILRLRDSWSQKWKRRYLVSAMLKWVATISEEFLRFLGERRPRALCIFAHWCAVTHHIQRMGKVWWIREKMVDEFRLVEEVVGKEWAACLWWPRELIRGDGLVRKGGVQMNRA